MQPPEQLYLARFSAEMRIDYGADTVDDVFAAVITVDDRDDTILIANLALGWENVTMGQDVPPTMEARDP